jgi:hypothetical protein
MMFTVAFCSLAHANATPGFVEDWSGTTTHNWSGGSTYGNPGTGGVDGVGDGYLLMSEPFSGRMGTFSTSAEYVGDWIGAGVTQVKFSLDDVNAPQNLEIHFSIGAGPTNFWQYNEGFVPLPNQWTEFVVDLTDASKFTQIIGSGTFTDALQHVDRIHLRNDKAPFQQLPDPITGDVGIDHLQLLGPTTAVRPSTWARLKALYH